MKPQVLILSLSFLIFLTFTATAQQPETTPPDDKDDSLKISTTLIQIDATVTDKDGNVVKDLKPEDFEVYENGKKQEITNLSFISVNPQTNKLEVTAPQKNSKNQPAIPVPPVKLKQEDVRRTYAIVVDDLGISFGNVDWVQYNLKKFVNEQMQDGDLVAIIRTGAGIGALQQFTSDRRQLLAAIAKIRWNPQGRGGISTFSPIGMDMKEQLQSIGRPAAQGGKEDKEFMQQVEDFRRDNFSVGTLGALNYVISGMRELPGRKSLLLISEGFVFRNPDGSRNRVFDGMQVLADTANRSSVVIYTADPRGLQVPGMFFAEDEVTDVFPESSGSVARDDREAKFNQSQQSLRYLSYQTGGFPFDNQNSLGTGILKAVNDQNSYYLIGYQPDEETFDPKKNKFNRLVVKVLRPGLKIRYRSGFFNIAEEKIRQATQTAQTPQQKLVAALVSPFGASDIDLDLYSIFYNDPKNRNFIRSLVVIDANDLTFTLAADGLYHTKFEALAAVFDTDGARAENGIGAHQLKFTPEQLTKVREKGLVYDLPVPIVKTGAYQFRIAIRDPATGKVGAVSQYIEVPNLKKNKVTLSNFLLDNFTPEEWKKFSRGEFSGNPLVNSTARRYQSGTILRYVYSIYNAKLDRTRKPQLETQMRLIRDGKVVFDEAPTPLDVAGQTDPARLETSGAITLGKDLSPGSYILQVVVYDKAAGETNRFGTQFVEFEIVK